MPLTHRESEAPLAQLSTNTLKILHIDTERTWRGGENQIRLLVEGSQKPDVIHYLAAKEDSEIGRRLSPFCTPVYAKLRGGFDLVSAWQLARFCKKEGIHLVDAHTSNAHSTALLMKFLYPRLKIIVHRRVDFLPEMSWIGRLKYLTPHIDRFVAISEAIASILIEIGIPRTRIQTVCSAVDPSPYLGLKKEVLQEGMRQRFNLGPDVTLIGSAAALTKQKDFTTLLQALAQVKRLGAKFHCFIAGQGEEAQSLHELQEKLGLTHDITFLGWVEPLQPFLTSLDIFILSSAYEGLGTVIQEACHAGCAVVATRAGGIPEMIEHEVSGLLSSVGDSQGLAENITLLLDNKELRQRYAENAQHHICKHFSVEKMVEDNVQLYRELARRP